jgi:MucR family transcriptional regulator, transcriptional regulator of exopolysaccharide biosynthesis
MTERSDQAALAEMTAEIVSAFVSHNQVRPVDLGHLVGLVGSRLASLASEQANAVQAPPEPAVPIRRSIGKDHMTCLICGQKQKLLKRHLATAHELTPAQYRERFGLKSDYPMVAPNYAKARSEMALRIGLGRPKKAGPAKRGRPPKAATAKAAPAKRAAGKAAKAATA